MTTPSDLNEAFERFAERPQHLMDGACLVAQAIGMSIDRMWVDAELMRLATGVGDDANAANLISYLAREGFCGADTYYHPENSSIEHVLRTRRGIPISLAVVILEVARQLELEASGINFPQHFLVRVGDLLIDPFQMTAIDEGALERSRTSQSDAVSDQDQPMLPTANNAEIVLRMLNNVKMLAQQREDHAAALDLSAYQLLLSDQKLPIYIERVDLWIAAGVPDMACLELEHAINATDDKRVKSVLAARRLTIEQTPSRLN